MGHDPHPFDPQRAGRLDRPERQAFLPNGVVLDLLALSGNETVVDYGAGTGTLTVPLARRLVRRGGIVYAVDENPEMMRLLRQTLGEAGLPNVEAREIRDDNVPLEDDSVDRVLAVNLLHHVVETGSLAEMRRLLAPGGLLLVVDWRADVHRDFGPPKEVTLSPEEARRTLEEVGFRVESVQDAGFPYHFALLARVPESRDP